MKHSKQIFIGFLLTTVFLCIHLIFMNDYGLTWDFHQNFFSGLYFIGHELTNDLILNIPFGSPNPWEMFHVPFGQLMHILAASGYVIFFEQLKLLPFDSAFHLSTVFLGSMGILFLYFFLLDAYGFKTALIGSIILALYPRYFADTQNNIKDTPQAAAFALSILFFYKYINKRHPLLLIAASLSFALAFNIKINSIFILVVGFLWIIIIFITKANNHLKVPLSLKPISKLYPILLYFPLSLLLALTGWVISWKNPIQELIFIPKFFMENTKNLEVLYFGNWYCSTVNIPWHYPFGYLTIVTPLPVLLFFLIGLICLVRQIFVTKKPAASLLIIWFIIPISRFVLPHMGVLDGIRHFLEVVYPLSAIAAIGFVETLQTIKNIALKQFNNSTKTKITVFANGLLILYLAGINIIYHPYQTAYYNELVGGIHGALGKFDIDYWGTSQKKAAEWLNKNAPKDSIIYVFMVPDIVARYLRPDLRVRINTTDYDHARYVMVLNRQSFFYRYIYTFEYFLRRKTAYVVENQGVPLTWVYDNTLGFFPRAKKWWTGESPCIYKYWPNSN
jgi:hypothetical protein